MRRGFSNATAEARSLAKLRAALTLVELLVVIVILTTLVAAAIPVMAPAANARRLREGARQLNTMIASAQSKAIGTGRPVGIWLEKLSTQTGQASDRGAVTTVYYCEEPPPFRGFSDDSAVIFQRTGGGWRAQFIRNRIDPDRTDGDDSYPPEALPPGLIRPFDRIRVGTVEFRLLEFTTQTVYQSGPNAGYYGNDNQPVSLLRCGLLDPSKAWNDRTFDPPNSAIPAGTWTYPMPYSIQRAPQKSAVDPLQLPDGIVVDLEGSGDSGDFGFPHYGGFYHDPLRPYPAPPLRANDNDDRIVFMFGPRGNVSRVFRNAGKPVASGMPLRVNYVPTGSIHLLVAQRENVGESSKNSEFHETNETTGESNKTNWMNSDSIWVSVNAQSGRVATNENAVVNLAAFRPNDYPDTWTKAYKRIWYQRQSARELARSNFGKGGR